MPGQEVGRGGGLHFFFNRQTESKASLDRGTSGQSFYIGTKMRGLVPLTMF